MKKAKYLLGIVFCLCISVYASAQTISVQEFYLDEKDLTANDSRTERYDQNGNKCAIIRIQTTQKGFHFDVGSLGVQYVDEDHIGEIWVYVPSGIRHISIRHPQLGNMPNFSFPCRIDKARTYIMVITSDKVFVNTYDDTHKKTIDIEITPANSELILNGMQIQLDENGKAKYTASYGTYTWKVTADRFYPKEGQLEVNDENDSLVVNDLRPIMGTLAVSHNTEMASIYIDGELRERGGGLHHSPYLYRSARMKSKSCQTDTVREKEPSTSARTPRPMCNLK